LRDTRTRVVIGEPIASAAIGQREAMQAAVAALLARASDGHDHDQGVAGSATTGDRASHELGPGRLHDSAVAP
jgi:hypothetical protein